MISEGSCDTEDWCNNAENSALHHRNYTFKNSALHHRNYTFKYIL